MDSLANYGSDDDYSSGDDKIIEPKIMDRNYRKPPPKAPDVNYDDVGMDLSEDSDDEKKSRGRSPDESQAKRDERDRRTSPKHRDGARREDERCRERARHSRDDRRDRDRHGRDDRGSRGDKNGRHDDRDYKSRDRDRRRSRSREKRRRSRSRSRSGSRERRDRGGYSRRYDRASYKMDKLGKMGIEIKKPNQSDQGQTEGDQSQNNRFFMPGITGRFRDQIERRKMLWQKKSEPEKTAPEPPKGVIHPQPNANVLGGGSRATKVWETTTFAQDTDGKVASKFKRLMGIKKESEGQLNPTDILKKQEEMFSSMEQQYEVARTATHTMRGVGLGFGSFQK